MLEADLVVALAGAAMRDEGRSFSHRNFHLRLSNNGTGHRGAEQVLVLVDGAGAQGREDVAGEELLAQVLDEHFAGAGLLRLLGDGVHVVALADVADDGDDVAGIILLQPGNDDRGIKTARIREDYFICHSYSKFQFPVPQNNKVLRLRGGTLRMPPPR